MGLKKIKCQRKCNNTACVCFCAPPLQDMNSAVITPCSHFFHAGCLKKWLYVQETCPLCHSQLKSQSPTTTVPNQDTPAANQSPAGQEEATANKRQKDGALPDDGKEEGGEEQEGDNGPAMSAGETPSSSSSSGVPSAPQHLVKTLSSSTSSSSSPLVTESKNQSPTDHPSSSSSSDTLDVPPSPPSVSCSSTPSNSRHSSSQPLAQAKMTPTEPEPAPQLNPGFLLDSQESSTGPLSQPDQPTSPSEEQSPTPCSL